MNLREMRVGTCKFCQLPVTEADSWGSVGKATKYPPDVPVYHTGCWAAGMTKEVQMISILKYELPAADSVSPARPFNLEIPFTAQVLSLQVMRLHNPCLWVRTNTEDRKTLWTFRWFATGESPDFTHDYVGTVQIPTGYADGSVYVHHLFVEHQKRELSVDGEKKLPESVSAAMAIEPP